MSRTSFDFHRLGEQKSTPDDSDDSVDDITSELLAALSLVGVLFLLIALGTVVAVLTFL